MKKTIFIIMLLTIFSKFFGFARDIILSFFYGASNISDAFIISLTIPTVLLALIGKGIGTAYIPLFSEIDTKFGDKKSYEFTNNVLNISIFLCTLILVFGMIFTTPLVKLFAAGFDKDTLALSVLFTKIMLIGMYFTLIGYIFRPFLQLKNNYYIPALIGLPLNILIILSIIISNYLGVLLLPIGSLIAIASQLFLVLPFVFKTGFRYKPILNLKDRYIKKMLQIAIPVVLAVSVNEINVLIDRNLASKIAVGGISALKYSNQINLFIHGIIVMSFATVLYPTLSKMSAEGNMAGLKTSMSEYIRAINLLLLPATIGLMIFSQPIITLLFGRGAFDIQAIELTSSALFYYSIGMVGFGLREVILRVFYSMKNSKIATINATIGVVLNIVLNIILSRYLGIGGLALATSISAIFTTVLLLISLRIKIGSLGIRNMMISFLKILVASLIMGFLAKISFELLSSHFSQNLSLIIAVCIGALIYFFIVYFMRFSEIDIVIKTIKSRFKNRSI